MRIGDRRVSEKRQKEMEQATRSSVACMRSSGNVRISPIDISKVDSFHKLDTYLKKVKVLYVRGVVG